jgi:hypothetical protein
VTWIKKNSKSYNESLYPVKFKKHDAIDMLFIAFVIIGGVFVWGWTVFFDFVTGIIGVGIFFSLVIIIGALNGKMRHSAFQMELYKYSGEPLRVLVKYRKEILFNTKDMSAIVGVKKGSSDPSCLNLNSAVDFANSHNTDFRIWLNEAKFSMSNFKRQTPVNLKLDDDWTNVEDKNIWLDYNK